jgi:carboxypeptidase C (cathepsin A)
MAETVEKTAEAEGNGHGTELPPEELSETSHTVTIDGQEIRYRATAGRILLKEEEDKEKEQREKAKASIFFVAYTRDAIDDASRRPVTFAFNGGPGSSSVWLHLGLLGPRRVLMDSTDSSGDALRDSTGAGLDSTDAGRDSSDAQVKPPAPPYRLVDNAQSLLDVTDLVFIDPVSTGYSRAVPGEKPDQFHDFKKDIESVGDFIRLYTSRFQRWSSPKHLLRNNFPS